MIICIVFIFDSLKQNKNKVSFILFVLYIVYSYNINIYHSLTEFCLFFY